MPEKIRLIFDTSYLESINYDFDSKIFSNRLNKECIDIFIPEIVDREIIKHLKEISDLAVSNLKKIPSNIRNILFNTEYQNINKLKSQIYEIALDNYDTFKNNLKISIIRNDKNCCDEMWTRYFSHTPPFGNRNKKNEFPDAMALLSIYKFLNNSSIDISSVIVVSNDIDWKKYCEDVGIFIICNNRRSSEILINELNKRQPLLYQSIVMELLNNYKNIIDDKIKMYFENISVELNYDSESSVVNFEIIDFNVELIDKGSILSVEKNNATVLFNVNYYIEVSYYEADSWQKYDSDIYYTDSTSGNLQSSVDVIINIQFADELENIDIEDYEIIKDDIKINKPEILLIDIFQLENLSHRFKPIKWY